MAPVFTDVKACALLAKAAGANYFGLEANNPDTETAQCWFGGLEAFQKYYFVPKYAIGQAINGYTVADGGAEDGDGNLLGGTWVATVYSTEEENRN